MKNQDGFFKTPKGEHVYYQYWLPDDDPCAVILIVHGLAEHCGRYMNVINRFVPLGYAVYSLDHLGHGKSDGTRVYLDRFQDFIDPLNAYLKMVLDWQPGLPVFVMGHSLGGLIATIYLLDYQDQFKGAILSGASIKMPDNINNTTIFVGKLLSSLTPKVGVAGLDARFLCHDTSVVDAYVNDPLVTTGKTTARLGSETLKAMERVNAEATKITLPVLILHGNDDQIINPEASRLLYSLVGSADKTLKIYDGYFHEIYNEPGRELVFQDVEKWLINHK